MERRFSERMRIDVDLDVAQSRFMIVAEDFLDDVTELNVDNATYMALFKYVARVLGESYYDAPIISALTGQRFLRTLRGIEAAYEFFSQRNDGADGQQRITNFAMAMLRHADRDLGIVWHDGVFVRQEPPSQQI